MLSVEYLRRRCKHGKKEQKNVQATPAVVVGPVQYKVALYARISVENEQKREADTIGNQIALLKDFVSQHQDLVVFDLYCDDDIWELALCARNSLE